MSFKGQSYYGMSHFGMLNNLSSLWMSFNGQDHAMSLLVMCMYLLWWIKNFCSVFLWAGGGVNKTIKSEQLTCSRDWRFCSSELWRCCCCGYGVRCKCHHSQLLRAAAASHHVAVKFGSRNCRVAWRFLPPHPPPPENHDQHQSAHERCAILLVEWIPGFPLCFFLFPFASFSLLVEDDKT